MEDRCQTFRSVCRLDEPSQSKHVMYGKQIIWKLYLADEWSVCDKTNSIFQDRFQLLDTLESKYF